MNLAQPVLDFLGDDGTRQIHARTVGSESRTLVDRQDRATAGAKPSAGSESRKHVEVAVAL